MVPEPPSPGSSPVRYDGWRVALLTVAPSVVPSVAELLRAKGHELVALVLPAGPDGPRPKTPHAWSLMHRLLQEAPPGCDVLVAHRRNRLAPLLESVKPDLVLTFFYPWRVPPEALAVPTRGAVNVHPALLPRLRGPNPLAWALRNDEPEVGLTFHRMEAQFDTGPILAQGTLPLTDHDTVDGILDKLMILFTQLLPEVLSRVAWGETGELQSEEGASQAGLFEEAYREIDWSEPARAVHLRVRACRMSAWRDGIPYVALATLEGQRIQILTTRLPELAHPGLPSDPPGTVLSRNPDGSLLVQCGDSPVVVVQTEPSRG
ncbi:methionyl-tRNA formyltransferase [Hyalangium sp.]|uniref:methionyl-tRNA formyltransferase n=1 Tax=Hyalangium sp. TaxID=2028555 RepID=UPI002D531C1B|nr:formyltransferase family protein [Hyalangium sp.]HYI00119.1 formyltransferase family protein [Hyalangium sp.]